MLSSVGHMEPSRWNRVVRVSMCACIEQKAAQKSLGNTMPSILLIADRVQSSTHDPMNESLQTTPFRSVKLVLMLWMLVPVAMSIRAADFDLGTHGVLSITAPENWIVKGQPAARPDGTPIGYTMAIKPPGDVNAKCLLTFAYGDGSKPALTRVRNKVLDVCEEFVANSVEKKKTLKDFPLKAGFGAYCVFTDAAMVGKKPEIGEYKIMGSGVIELNGDLHGAVSIFADEVDGKEFRAMIEAISSLTLKAKPASLPSKSR